MDLTKEARDGYDWQLRTTRETTWTPAVIENEAAKACPFLWSSPGAMAWHLGRFLCRMDEPAPEPAAAIDAAIRRAVTSGRGYTLNVRGRKDILLGRYEWRDDNNFRVVRA